MLEQGGLKSGSIEIKVTDTLGTPINPMSEETGTAIKLAVQNPPAPPAPEGGATEANQLTMLSIIPWLKTILLKIVYPAWYDATANVIRNQVQSGTITTVTTVTTVSGLTNLDGYQAKLQVINQNNGAWAQVVRARIS